MAVNKHNTSKKEYVEITHNRPVFMINSKLPLNLLNDHISKYGNAEILNVVFDQKKRETNRTAAVLSEQTYRKLCDDGYDRYQNFSLDRESDFVISRFRLNPYHFPGESKTDQLFIPVPQDLENKQVESYVTGRLDHLVECDVLDENSFKINKKIKSRRNGGIGGFYVNFSENVSQEDRALCRLLLNDTFWPESLSGPDNQLFMRCFWARKTTPRKPRSKTPSSPQPKLNREDYYKSQLKKTD